MILDLLGAACLLGALWLTVRDPRFGKRQASPSRRK